MNKGYFVYGGIEHFDQPVASFTLLEDAIEMSKLLSSHTEPQEITGDNHTEIDKYVDLIHSGKQPFDIALYGDGSLFEIDNGFEGCTLFEPIYYPENEGSFAGTFWGKDSKEAVNEAQNYLAKLKAE